MTFVIAGATSGLLMASVFVSLGALVLMLFFIVKDGPAGVRERIAGAPVMAIMVGVVLMAYPTWGVIGAVIGVLYGATTTDGSVSGAGSPNLVYSLAIAAVAVAMAVPAALILRRALAGLAAMTLLFVGIFGWLLPFFAG